MMRMGMAAAAATTVWAGAAGAMVPLLMCEFGDAAGTPQEISGYNHTTAGEGFVIYDAYETATDHKVAILEYCPGRQQLLLRTETGQVDAALDSAAYGMFDEMIYGSVSYTMTQMAGRLRGIGAVVEMRTVTYESCACANQ